MLASPPPSPPPTFAHAYMHPPADRHIVPIAHRSPRRGVRPPRWQLLAPTGTCRRGGWRRCGGRRSGGGGAAGSCRPCQHGRQPRLLRQRIGELTASRETRGLLLRARQVRATGCVACRRLRACGCAGRAHADAASRCVYALQPPPTSTPHTRCAFTALRIAFMSCAAHRQMLPGSAPGPGDEYASAEPLHDLLIGNGKGQADPSIRGHCR
eukprot:365582-Chlamydomonas_euryale.AAC.8